MPGKLLNRPVTIIRRGPSDEVDEDGNEVPSVSEVETVAELQPARRRENESTEEVGEEDWIGYFPAGTDLATGDAIEDEDGIRFELIGPPAPWRNPRTRREHHVEVTMRRTAGSDEAS